MTKALAPAPEKERRRGVAPGRTVLAVLPRSVDTTPTPAQFQPISGLLNGAALRRSSPRGGAARSAGGGVDRDRRLAEPAIVRIRRMNAATVAGGGRGESHIEAPGSVSSIAGESRLGLRPAGQTERRSAVVRRVKVKGKGKETAKPPRGGVGREPYPHIRVVAGERVRLRQHGELAEAKRIVGSLQTEYHIDLNSKSTIEAIQANYSLVPKKELKKLEATVWEMKELRAILAAVQHFAPILGSRRADSSLAAQAQGVTTIGRLTSAIDVNTAGGKEDPATLAETFASNQNIGFFNPLTNLVDRNFALPGAQPTNQIAIEATAIHEMTHALIEPFQLGNWVRRLGYWLDANTATGRRGAEQPPTSYGRTNAAEDLCESVAMFFINRGLLTTHRPERAKFIAKVIADWSPPARVAVLKTAISTKSGCTRNPVRVGT